jgi:ABC-type bacteriocin/lantibiotic exporter with double-glycine peptidase domain
MSQADNLVISAFPKVIIEAILYAAIIYLVWNNELNSNNQLVVFGIAALRLVPVAQQIYASLASIKSSYLIYKNNIIEGEGRSSQINNKRWSNEVINIESLTFGFNDQMNIEVSNIEIRNGDKIGIVGPSGVGKTTLIDVFSNLIPAKKLKIRLNDEYVNNFEFWRDQIEYLDQNIFLPEVKLKEYIFSEDVTSYKEALFRKNAFALDMEFLADKLDEFIGPKGLKLSGGQKQRLALIKTLQTEKKIIILDEPTSALDNSSIVRIGDLLGSMNKLLIVVTHDESLMKIFNKIIRIDRND